MGRIKSIDGLRGVAMLIVFLSHFAVMYYPSHYWDNTISHLVGIDTILGNSPLEAFISGNVGVCIFLTITGIGTYYVCISDKKSTIKYLLLRFFKLLLIAGVASVITAIVKLIGGFDYYRMAEQITGSPWLALGGFEGSLNVSYKEMFFRNPIVNLSKINGVLWMLHLNYRNFGKIL